ncbi:PREDICTED: taste receptor type 2 member 8 [Propithecus coquereli]|uniref:taste receptor type 2 member 8 n=1 Tax=Propithecus coquereli TaxID=379532 RepID=UPI00063F4ECD|nr:PREDICTED: taste receptor type 2 member 8 [Propithecus coquereli]
MFHTKENIFVIIITGEFIIGMLGNGYIGLVNWIDWNKKKKISSIDFILTNLAISRICLIGVMVLNGIIMVLYPDVYATNKLMVIIYAFWTLFNYLSVWFSTCLNVFYFLKIASFSHPLFLWLKWRIDRVVHWILLGCLAISLLVSLITALELSHDYRFYKMAQHKRNITEMLHVSRIQYFDPVTLPHLLTVVPFAVSLISFLLLVRSLWRHTEQMKLHATGCRDPSREAHVRAIKIVTSFLFFLFLYYVLSLMVSFSYLMKEHKLVLMFSEIVLILYPLGHSLILIIINNKLRQASVRMLMCRKIACMI